MKIKICGLFRSEDIFYVNEARPDYAGFVFAESRRQVSPTQAEHLRSRLADGITPVGVFVNAPPEEIAALYRDGVINIAQLHGGEDEEYISKLKDLCGIPVIKVFKSVEFEDIKPQSTQSFTELLSDNFASSSVQLCVLCGYKNSDYYLFDSGAGSGKTFNWDLLEPQKINKPWFLAGGINLSNIEKAIFLNPYAIDVSGGAETNGVKDREKILQLTLQVKERASHKGTEARRI